jgi:hypothetical protein
MPATEEALELNESSIDGPVLFTLRDLASRRDRMVPLKIWARTFDHARELADDLLAAYWRATDAPAFEVEPGEQLVCARCGLDDPPSIIAAVDENQLADLVEPSPLRGRPVHPACENCREVIV